MWRWKIGVIVVLVVLSGGLACSKGGSFSAAYTGDPASDLVLAARSGDTSKIASLLDAEPAFLSAQFEEGQTLLHLAALGNQPKIIRLLVEKGLDINTRDAEGKTPLGSLKESNRLAPEAKSEIIRLGGK